MTQCKKTCAYYYEQNGLKTCVSGCADSYAFRNVINESTTECVAACTYPKPFQNEGECVEDCAYYHEVDGAMVCDERCSADKPYHRKFDDDTMECVAQCPQEQQWVTDGKCGTGCAASQYTVEADSNGVSVNRCLDETQIEGYGFYTEEQVGDQTYKRRYKSCQEAGLTYNAAGKCVAACDQTFDETNTCKTCLAKNGTFWNAGECVDKCPEDTFLSGDKCIAECALYYLSEDQVRVCTPVCPDGKQLTKKVDGSTECVAACTDPKPFQNGGECVEDCAYYYVEG